MATQILRIGTRGSKLALVQVKIILNLLRKINSSYQYKITVIKTKGDLDKKKPLFSMDRKGIFEKEIDEAVVNREVDFAVHSIKDVPSDLPPSLILASIPKRESPGDVLISKNKIMLKDLPSGSVIGTSSLRRAVQLLSMRNDLEIKPIRGNVETRIKKVLEGNYTAIVLAEAGLKRMKLTNYITERLDKKKFVPAPGQGAMGLICRRDNYKLIKLLKKIEHKQSKTSILAERSLVSKIEGGCRFPIGAFARSSFQTQKIYFHSKIFSADGKKIIDIKKTGNYKYPKRFGNSIAKLLIKNGALDLAKDWEVTLDEWNRN
ncbi:MAG: hydroxymethylbilane synthase [Nitrososphaeraceae archaeon]